MSWYGKVLGAVLGAIIGRGLFGAIVGLLIGHQFDRRRDSETTATARQGAAAASPAELRRAFFQATFQVMGHVAKADGRVSEQEIDAARSTMTRFALTENDRRRAMDLFTDGKRADFPLENALRRLRVLAGGQPELCRMFVQIQLEAALHGNGLNPASRAVFGRICGVLGVSALEFASLEAMARMRGYNSGGSSAPGGGPARGHSALADAYEVLGVASSASDADVTLAYRRLMSQHHPDKLVAQGLPESMVAAAHERTQRILEAYETVKNHRGLK
ncbi:MAG TPA: co-chaperone DjlA [Steroidobacteraceae bacterium]